MSFLILKAFETRSSSSDDSDSEEDDRPQMLQSMESSNIQVETRMKAINYLGSMLSQKTSSIPDVTLMRAMQLILERYERA